MLHVSDMEHFFLGGVFMAEKLTILFFTKRFQNRLEKSTEYLIDELGKHVNLIIWEKDGDLEEILAHIQIKPAFILLNDFKRNYSPLIWNLTKSPCPVGAIFHEVKYKPFRRREFYEREQIEHLFVHYKEASLRFIPKLKDRYIWFPHHVPLTIYKDYGEEREVDILMLGAMLKSVYPERVAFYEMLRNEPGFLYVDHPGYGELKPDELGLTGERYARQIAKAKLFITCDSVEKIPVMKYFESLACKTLLLATGSAELRELGFIDGETFVEIRKDNLLEKVRFYLSNHAERERIIENGYQLIVNRHSTEKRVSDLVNVIERILVDE